MNVETPIDWTSKIIPIGLTGVFSLIIGVLIEKFKNRISILKYSTSFQSIATSSQEGHWGAIEVYHNGRITKHLNFVTIKIENSSNIDLQDVNIDVSCDSQSQFLAHNAFYTEGNKPILLEQGHSNFDMEVSRRMQADFQLSAQDASHVMSKQLTDEIIWVQTNKKFHLPVLNRKTEITINLLAENYQAFIPTISVGVLHKSVKLMESSDADTDAKNVFFWSLGIGLVIMTIGLYLLLNQYPSSKEPIVITVTLALTSSAIGLLIIILFRFIKRLL